MRDAAALRLGIAGLGHIGQALVRAVGAGQLPGFELVAVAGRNREEVVNRLQQLGSAAHAADLDRLAEEVDVIVECLTPAAAVGLIEQGLQAGRTVVVLSSGALLMEPRLTALAKAGPGRLVVPTGAILGLDVIRAAALGRVDRVLVRTRKPPQSLSGAPIVAESGIDLQALAAPVCVFKGNANQAVRAFPQNVNVAASVSLAGIGGDRTLVEVWADPGVDSNIHEVELDADCSTARMQIVNHPSVSNPRTSAVTLNSLICALQSMTGGIRIGT